MSRSVRSLFVLAILMFLSAPVAFSGLGDGDLRLSDFTGESNAAASPAIPRRAEGIGRALDALLAGRTLPIPCASPLLLELGRHRESLSEPVRESIRLLSIRPNLPRDGMHATRDGRFVIHYTVDAASPDAIEGTDSDLNGVPDQVDRVELALDRAMDVLIAGMSWPLPAPGPRADHYDLYLVSLGSGRGGFTAPEREIAATPQADSSSHILVDGRLDPASLEAAVIHQFAHASLLALSARAPAWWTEATAAWMETRVTGDPSRQAPALGHRLERLDRSLAGDSLLLSQGDSLFVSFLADRLDGDGEAVLRIWTEQSLRASEPFTPLLDEILSRNGGDGLAGAYRDFTRWVLFTGGRDDGAHFRQGSLFPPLVPLATFETFPAEIASAEPVEPLGAAVYRLAGDGSRGGVRIRVEAEVPSLLEVDLVITPSAGDRRPYLVELSPDTAGVAEAGIPWHAVGETMVIVRNPAAGGKPVRSRVTAILDPLFPYDLSSFSALASPGGITLQWSTGREIDLLGWNVYRSSAPGGPFLRINPVTLPSGGDSREETDYIYQDTSALEGHRYFYQVEGITIRGLPEPSFSVSAEAEQAEPFP